MNLKPMFATVGLLATLVVAYAAQLKPGTEVNLVFRQSLSSRSAKAGDDVSLAVKNDVMDDSGHVILAAGTRVHGVIEKVDKNDHFGKNARIRIVLNPVKGIALEPRDKGKLIGGTRSDEAGALAGGGALVLGPLGLAAGYFVVGHPVSIHAGSTLRTVVSDK